MKASRLFLIVAVLAACTGRNSAPQTALPDATTSASAASSAAAPAASSSTTAAVVADAGAAAAPAPKASTPAPPTREELVGWLKGHVPKGGSVVDADPPQIKHTIQSGDTYTSIATAYVDMTEVWTAAELSAILAKKNPTLTAGQKIDIPSIIKRPPRDANDERLGWPEDRALRGVFMTGDMASRHWIETLDKLAGRGLNAVVLDAKDYMGQINYPSKSKIGIEIGAVLTKPPLPDLARFIRFAHARGIRIISRIPCFHDPWADKKLKGARLSFKAAGTGAPLHTDWIDPTNTESQDYAVQIAQEQVEAGTDEVQLDYVRFPVHFGDGYAKMPPPKDRSNVIRDFVRRVHAITKPAGVMLSLDLFGVTATGSRSDIEHLGQDIAVVGPEAEAISPMVYPSHYDKGYNGYANPADHPEIVGIGTKGAVAQLEKAGSTTVVRSWIQAFSWRTTTYNSKYVVDQTKSAESNGGAGWLMWSPSCDYWTVWSGFPRTDGKQDPPKK